MSGNQGDAYSGIAGAYAARVDAQPTNAHYERPAMLSLLPPLAGLEVLDVGCGSGWYAETMIAAGARVTSFDLNPEFVSLARARLGDRGQVHRADLAEPLGFAATGAFDLVVAPLVLHYLEDWRRPFAEFARVLRPGGRLVFSTHHPFMDWRTFDLPDYFATVAVEDEWDIGKVRFWRRPLTRIVDDLGATGFVVERLVEPQPQPAMATADPERHARLMTQPWFLLIRARRP